MPRQNFDWESTELPATFDAFMEIPGTSIRYRHSRELGWEVWYAEDRAWHFTYGPKEGAVPANGCVDLTSAEDAERELFGETLDEPIPDDLYEMIASV